MHGTPPSGQQQFGAICRALLATIAHVDQIEASQGNARPRNYDTEGKTMTTIEATKSKTSSGTTRSGQLFVLELSGTAFTR